MYDYLHICTTAVYNRTMDTKPLGAYVHTLIQRRGLKIGDVQSKAGVAQNYLLRLRKNQGGEPILANLNALVDIVGGNRDHIQQLLRNGATIEEGWALAHYVLTQEAAPAMQHEAQQASEEELRQAVVEFEQAASRDRGLLVVLRSLLGAWKERDNL